MPSLRQLWAFFVDACFPSLPQRSEIWQEANTQLFFKLGEAFYINHELLEGFPERML